MAKQLNVNLAFTADTGKAKAQIQELQTLLNQIAYTGTTSNVTGTMQQDLQKASSAAKELQFHLNNAFNATTGKFDLSLLDKSLKSSKSNITDLSTSLLSAGSTGQQAFLKLAQSISLADQPMLRISNRMREFGTVMKNTIKWQLSSSMIHGFMGALQSAYGYAQDLNASLNDIRIVTGSSSTEMAKFAEQANKAAKSLSTTTTDYTKASLIYFQQGLSDAEVEERTNVTIKMANAAGVSAQTVSDQMTAVWNNFDDGSKSLEYYADVMAALGAATASSTDEIAQGLEKFAAVSETVGLSYEYATAALTAIMSNTRESADVVGTALKTLFARIQGLQLGETLEDGTDLNKYSQALEKVGISIYENNGELKTMDNILDEMAAKWDTLGNAEQTALAQTVAGVRQYTQLVALMENWDNGDSDSFQANLRTISGAEGTIDKQADIYAQSWEAAEKRVRAAAEGIYQSLLDDDFFISLNNGFANALNGIDAFIDGLGGVGPLITSIASIFISNFAHKIPQALDDLKYNLSLLSPKGTEKTYNKIQTDITKASQDQFDLYRTSKGQEGINEESSMGYAIKSANDLTAARTKLALVSSNLSEAEKQMANTQLSIIQTHQDEIIALKQKNEVLQESMNLSKTRIQEAANGSIYGEQIDAKAEQRAATAAKAFDGSGFQVDLDQLESYSRNIAQNINQNLITAFKMDGSTGPAQLKGAFDELKQVADGLTTTLAGLGQGDGLETARTKVKALVSLIPEGTIAAAGLKDKLDNINNADSGEKLAQAFKDLITALDGAEIEAKDFQRALKGIDDGTFRQLLEQSKEFGNRQDQIAQKQTILNGLLENFKPTHIVRTSEALGSLGGMMGNFVSIARSISSAFQSLSNPDLSGWEKFIAVLTSVSMIIPSTISMLKSMGTMYAFLVTQSHSLAGAMTAEQAARVAANSSGAISAAVSNMVALGKLKELAATQGNIAGMTAEALAEKVGITVKQADIIITKLKAGATLTEAAAEAGLTATLWAQVAAWIATWTAMSPVLVIVLAIAAAVAVLSLAIWGIVKAWKAWKASTPEAQLESAKKATEGMTAAAEAANDAYQDLLNTISGYESAIASLEGMEQGTQEFTNALIDANEKAWELISAYNLIQGQDWNYNPETGAIEFTEGTLDNIQYTQQENLEDMNAGVGAARINEAQKEVDLAASNIAPYLQENLSQAYEALGLDSTGRFESLMEEWTKATNELDDAKIAEIATEVGKRYYGEDFNFETADSSQISRLYELLFSGEEFAQLQQAQNDLNNVQQTEVARSISNSLLNEQEFQDASWKQAIIDEATQNYDVEKAKADASWDAEGEDAKTAEQVAAAFDQYLSDNGLTKGEDGKVYDKDNNEVSDLSNLDDAGMRNILAAVDALNAVEAQALDYAESFNALQGTMTEEETTAANALINQDINQLTQEQIEAFKAQGGIELTDLFDPTTLKALENNEILGPQLSAWLESLNQQIAEWEPQPLDLESWKSDYASKMDIVNNLEYGETISKEDYDLLGDEYSQYFQEQLDGTYKLVVAADTLKNAVDQIETDKLKEAIENDQDTFNNTINAVSESTNGMVTSAEQIDYAVNDIWGAKLSQGTATEEDAQRWLDSNVGQGLAEGLDIDLSQYDTAIEKVQALSDAWNGVNTRLGENQAAMALTAESMYELEDMQLDNDAYIEGLKNLGAQYESCQDELEEYIEAVNEYGEESDEAKKASEKLAKAIKKAEWDKFTDEALDAAKALKTATNADDIEDNLSTIQKAFKTAFNMDVTMDQLEQFKDDFVKWGEATEEESDDIATHIMSKINAENFDMDAFKKEMEIVVNANTDPATQALWNLSMTADQIKGFIEANPPTVHANGTADFSQLVAEMLAAGATAADVAAALAMIGQTTVDFSAWGEGLGTYDFSDPESVFQFTQDLAGWSANIESSGDASGANIIQKAFPDGNIPTVGGSGGGRHGGGSSGGGGGGGSESEPQTVDRVKHTDIVDRYREIDNAIDDLTETMDDATEVADRLYGADRIKAMEKVNNLLEQEIALNKQKIHEAQHYLEEDKQEVDSAAAAMGVEFTYDKKGNITNYTEVMNQLYRELNQAIDDANADGDATDEEQEAIDDIQERIDDIKDAVEQYDETKELIEDLNNDIEEALYEMYDNELEMIQYQFELDLQIQEDDMSVLEYQLSRIEDDAFSAAEQIALINQQMENLYDQANTNKAALEEIFGLSASQISIELFGNDETLTEEQAEAIRDYRDSLLEINEQYDNLRATVEDKVMEVFDAWNEKLETSMDNMEHYSSVLESYKNIVDIVGQTTLGLSDTFMAGMEQKVFDNALDNMKATQAAYDTMVKAKAEAEAALAEAQANGDEKSAKLWEETLTELNSNMQEAQEDFLGSWEDALSLLSEHFEAAVERVVAAFNEAVYAYGGLEGLSEEFSRQQEMADAMVDDYAKIYELSKLNRDIQKTIDDTDVIAGKQKLKKLQQEINALTEDGVEMSKYDLEYLQAEYELRMAEIELENAQAKKDTVQLSKDNEGNWSYVYTTSTDAVDAAQQKYEDALYAMQELSSNYIDEMSEQLISTSQEMAEALAEVQAADFANEEEYKAELDRIRKQYEEMMAQQQAELNKAIDNNDELYNKDMLAYEQATNGKYAAASNFATAFKDTLLGTLMDSESLTANFNEIMRSSVDILTTGLVEAASTYYSHLAQAMEAAGTSTDTFAEDMGANIEEVSKQSEEGAKAVEDMGQRMSDAFTKITEEVTAWQQTYGLAMEDIIQSNLDVITSFNEMLKELSVDPDAIHVSYDISTDYGIDQAASMDTGGYTGEWGNTGKLAILHEKEMVLSADDTLKLLEAMNISRTILETIELNARQASAGMGSLHAISVKEDNSETLEQNVHITAEFPSVSDHNEIEEAMKNLINTASQYANRK